MTRYEYLTVPAPKKGEKAKGVKGPDGRLAQAMTTLLNSYGADGWEYLRSDTLPLEERSGLTSKSVSYHTVLVFRREVEPELEIEGEDSFGAYPTEEIDAAVAQAEARAKAAAAQESDTVSPAPAEKDEAGETPRV